MSTDDAAVDETVDRLLDEADELLQGVDDPGDLIGDDDLQGLAEETRSFLEDAETAELLEAVGVDVPEGSAPTDLLMALREAESEPLVRRRRLELLSEIDGDGGDDPSTLEEFEALGAALEGDAEPDVDEFDLLDDESTADEEEPDADGGPDDDGAEADDTDAETGDDQEAEESSVSDDESGTGLAQHAGALKDAVDDIAARDPDGSAGASQVDDGESAAAGPEGDGDEESTGYEDSKIAASDRADMRVPLRHSTMPK